MFTTFGRIQINLDLLVGKKLEEVIKDNPKIDKEILKQAVKLANAKK